MKIFGGIIWLILFFVSFTIHGQSAFGSIDPLQYHRLERLEIKSGLLANTFHTDIKPYQREDIIDYINKIPDSLKNSFTEIDNANIIYLRNDSWEFGMGVNSSNINAKPILKHLFQKKSDMYAVQAKDFDIHISPIVGLGFGLNSKYGELPNKNVFVETRGFEIRGRISNKLGFYSMLTENVIGNPNCVVNYFANYGALPYQAFVKVKNDNTIKLQTDFYSATGYITFDPIKNLNITFGNDRNFIGSGIRSLVLSDFSPPYLQLKISLKIGRFQYMSLMGRMTNFQVPHSINNYISYPPKYLNLHHLNCNITKNLNVGFFESVMFGKRDYGFELAYLNPVIFTRYLEGFLGSSDNSMIGMDFKWNFLKKFGTYGQFNLDEYSKTEFKKDHWWSKKYAWQLGIRYIDVLDIKNLDFQAEFNYVRPYTFSHFTTYTNYVNYNLPIAHPLGANFTELLLIARYQPLPKLFITATHMMANKGDDLKGLNYGGNILLDNALDKPLLYGVEIHQGFLNKIRMLQVNAQYMLFHNFFIEANYTQRKDSYSLGNTERIQSLGIRWNLPNQLLLF